MSYGHFLQSGRIFWNCTLPSVPSLVRKSRSNPFPVTYIHVRTVKFFPACWILIGQFKFQARQEYERWVTCIYWVSPTLSSISSLSPNRCLSSTVGENLGSSPEQRLEIEPNSTQDRVFPALKFCQLTSPITCKSQRHWSKSAMK